MDSKPFSTFLNGAVQKQRRERYIGLLSNTKRHSKFLASLDHDLERDINTGKVVEKLSDPEWTSPCVVYSSQGVFGKYDESIKLAYESAPWEGGWLIISETGAFGVYRPEGKMDDELYIKL
jgi:hypothetical protein